MRISTRQILSWLGPRDRMAMAAVAALCLGLSVASRGGMQATLVAVLVAIPLAVLGAVAVAIVVIDLRQYRIPDRLSLPLIPLGLIHTAALGPVWPNLIAVGLVWAGLSLLARGFALWRGKTGLGGGDIKLMAAAAAWLSPAVLPDYLLAAALTGLTEALLRRRSALPRIAFGAHLAPWLVIFVLWRWP